MFQFFLLLALTPICTVTCLQPSSQDTGRLQTQRYISKPANINKQFRYFSSVHTKNIPSEERENFGNSSFYSNQEYIGKNTII